MSMKNSNDTIWNRTSNFPICSTAPESLCHRGPILAAVHWSNEQRPKHTTNWIGRSRWAAHRQAKFSRWRMNASCPCTNRFELCYRSLHDGATYQRRHCPTSPHYARNPVLEPSVHTGAEGLTVHWALQESRLSDTRRRFANLLGSCRYPKIYVWEAAAADSYQSSAGQEHRTNQTKSQSTPGRFFLASSRGSIGFDNFLCWIGFWQKAKSLGNARRGQHFCYFGSDIAPRAPFVNSFRAKHRGF